MEVQPVYKVEIELGGKMVDVTADVIDVSYSETYDAVNTLTLRLKNSKRRYIDQIVTYGVRVNMEGGSIDAGPNWSAYAAQNQNYRKFFSGAVVSIAPKFTKTGITELHLTCTDATWEKSSLVEYTRSFPGESPAWANKPSLTLEELIRQFVENEMKGKVGVIDIPKERNLVFTHEPTADNEVKAVKQYGMTNWFFLRCLAQSFGCVVWTEYDAVQDEYVVNFAQKMTQQDYVGVTPNLNYEITFRYLNREGSEAEFDNSALFSDTEIQIPEGELDLNIYAATAVTRQISKLNPDTGDTDTAWYIRTKTMNADGTYTEVARLYKYNTDAIANMTPEQQELLYPKASNFSGELSSMLQYEELIEKGILVPLETNKELAKDAWSFPEGARDGYKFNAKKMRGNVNVIGRKWYAINGIGAIYSTNGASEKKWLLMNITHSWNSEGYTMDAEFVR